MTNQSESNLKYAISSHAIENMAPSKRAVLLCRQNASGKIAADRAVEEILRDYGIQKGTTRAR